ncbi:MAG TPA: hypothetical protein VM760_05695, partial [Sphingomicrobium sp.]|nr:hypothetical protein [Sphingomicrobium sp.]
PNLALGVERHDGAGAAGLDETHAGRAIGRDPQIFAAAVPGDGEGVEAIGQCRQRRLRSGDGTDRR